MTIIHNYIDNISKLSIGDEHKGFKVVQILEVDNVNGWIKCSAYEVNG